MKIAFVSTLKGSPWGGSEELWTAACLRARADGHGALVSRYEWDEIPPKLTELERAGAKVSFRPRRPNKIARLFPRPAWLREIETFDPDVVCLSQGGAYECAGHRSARPLIKWLGRSRAALVNVIQFNARDTSLGTAAAEYARWLYNRASANAFVAQENIDMAAERLGIAIPRALVVNNPVNLRDRSALAWPSEADGVARLACVARLDARTKGQDMLLEVLGRSEWKARAWTLSLFGEGPDRGRYEEQIKALGIADRVKFRGFTSDVRAVWAEHHALVLPSRAEGTPLAMLEAMLLGRVCMVCNVGGCAGWVDDGVEGFIAPRPVLEDVAAAMERLWQAKGRWREMGETARRRADRQLGPDPGADLLRLLMEIAEKHRVQTGSHAATAKASVGRAS